MSQQGQLPEGLEVRYTELDDGKYLKSWLMDPSASSWFPMSDEVEIDDAVMRWIAFCRYKCSLTIVKEGVPCGIATLYLQPYRRLAHQCEFGIIIGHEYRGTGVGTILMSSLLHLAKEKFKIYLLHLQVCGANPAIRFYQRFGFKEFGRQEGWMKPKNPDNEDASYGSRVFMERKV
jgi:RimJ/RimL family protein N-acetyltransferase